MTVPAPVLIMAGGTGGHVFPALAVARALRERSESVIWLGTEKGLEARVVPADDFPLEFVRVAGLRRKGHWNRPAKGRAQNKLRRGKIALGKGVNQCQHCTTKGK